MDKLGDIISLGQCVYRQCEEMQDCKKQCRRLGDRVSRLLLSLKMLQAKGERNLSIEITIALSHFQDVLEKAKKKIDKFSNKSNILKFLSAKKDKILFKEVTKSLRDVWEDLILQLQLYQCVHISQLSSPASSWDQEDQWDAEEDWKVFQGLSGKVYWGAWGVECNWGHFSLILIYQRNKKEEEI